MIGLDGLTKKELFEEFNQALENGDLNQAVNVLEDMSSTDGEVKLAREKLQSLEKYIVSIGTRLMVGGKHV